MTSFVCLSEEKTWRKREGNAFRESFGATPGVSLRLFPKDESVRRQWEDFVHKHRPDFKPINTSVLCSVHFAPECFTRHDRAESKHNISGSRHLERGSIPTTDVLIEQEKPEQQIESEEW